MTAFLVDANVMIAATQAGHEHGQRARVDVAGRLARGEEMLISPHALLESYSVMTRMPLPGRVSPRLAREVLWRDYVVRGRIVGLSPQETVAFLHLAVDRGAAGGRIYDAVIAEEARMADADVLLTFNVRHFIGTPGLRVEAPAALP